MLTTFLKWIATFLGTILKAILPDLLKQGRKPRDVHVAGYDEEIENDISDSIEDEMKRQIEEDLEK